LIYSSIYPSVAIHITVICGVLLCDAYEALIRSVTTLQTSCQVSTLH